MFVDASAMLAILLSEPEADRFSDALEATEECFTSPIAIYETVTGLMRSHRVSRQVAEEKVDALVLGASMQIAPVTAGVERFALAAFEKYGKGRHKAQLNMGDCFAYACAKSLGVPLLYKGDDFARTDLA